VKNNQDANVKKMPVLHAPANTPDKQHYALFD